MTVDSFAKVADDWRATAGRFSGYVGMAFGRGLRSAAAFKQ